MRDESEIPGTARPGLDQTVDYAQVPMPVVEAAMGAEGEMADRPDDETAEQRAAASAQTADAQSADAQSADAKTALERDGQLRLVEAILFAASEPVSEAAIAKRMGRDADVVGLLNELADRYATRGVNVVKVGDKWTLRTAPDLAPRLKLEVQVARKLTRAAVETLAIIAYHQPVSRAEIEEIRGVAISPTTIEMLLEAGWIKPGRRREGPGRPGTFVTTEHFLSHFGLERLDDLPGIAELRAAGLLDARPVSVKLGTRERAEGEAADTPSLEDAADAEAAAELRDAGEETEADETPSAAHVERMARDAMEK
jgi:segregation and condensation protein B